MKKVINIAITIILVLSYTNSISQTQTVGVFTNDTASVFAGYTLFAPKHNSMTYLVNNEGKKIHEWNTSIYPPGQAVYLLENGNLLRSCMTQGQLGTGGGEGGRIEEYNWDDSLVWSMDYSTTTYMQHHDIKKLPNGNIIMLVVHKKTMSQIIAAGFDTSKFQPDVYTHGFFLPDKIVEVEPTYPTGGIVVWEWDVWDHLIQHFDSTKSNYGIPSTHPELIDCAGDHKVLPLFWNHMNSIDYNPALDQIAVSVRGNSEVWIIDHSTTMMQSASHTGGNHGKGGDLLYRWGNPICYGAGNASTQQYYQQHDVEWVKPGCPGEGNLTCYNNGVGLNYSRITEITPPIDSLGNYTITPGLAYGPTAPIWTYVANPPSAMYSENISGAERLPNGNTIICVGASGTFYEVTSSGAIVWKYICPTTNLGPLVQGDSIPTDITHPEETLNSVFRVYKYGTNYPAFNGKNIIPGSPIELYPTSIMENNLQSLDLNVYPNPFNNSFHLTNAKENYKEQIVDVCGQLIWEGYEFDEKNLSTIKSGVYLLKIMSKEQVAYRSIIKE
jgi:hypothetical protein